MKKRFTEAQIVREADAGVAIKDLCRKHGFSEASYYLWRSKFGGMSVSDAKRLGWSVTFQWMTRRMAMSSTTKTYSCWKVAVTTTKKSQARTALAWLWRNVAHDWADGPPRGRE